MNGISPNWKVFFTLLGVTALLTLLWFFRVILLYVICAVVLSFIAEPIADLCKKLRIKQWALPAWARALIAMLTLVLLLVGMVAMFAPIIQEEVIIIGQLDVRVVLEKFGLNHLLETYQQTGMADMAMQELTSAIQFNSIQNAFSGLLSWVGNLFIGIFAVLFIAFFFLKDGYLFTRIVFSLTPEKHMEPMKNIMEHTHGLLRRYFIGVAIQSLIMAVMIGLSLSLLGVKNALLIGVFAGLVNVIPYVGPVIGALFAMLIAATTALQGNAAVDIWPVVMQVVAVFAIAQQIDGFVVQPLILGNRVKAHPLEVFIVVLMAGMVGGVFGMIAAIPVYTIIRVIAREFFSAFKPIESLTRDL
jgi:predicted PurR-regulated permease PerM